MPCLLFSELVDCFFASPSSPSPRSHFALLFPSRCPPSDCDTVLLPLLPLSHTSLIHSHQRPDQWLSASPEVAPSILCFDICMSNAAADRSTDIVLFFYRGCVILLLEYPCLLLADGLLAALQRNPIPGEPQRIQGVGLGGAKGRLVPGPAAGPSPHNMRECTSTRPALTTGWPGQTG